MVDSVLDKAQDVVKTSGNQDIEKYIQETKEKYESHMNAAKVSFPAFLQYVNRPTNVPYSQFQKVPK